MAISSTQQNEILKVVAGLFNAAPGGVYLSELANLVEDGMSTSELADALADSPVFKTGILAGKVTVEDQVDLLMKNFGMVADNDPASAGSQAETYFTEQITNGVGLGKIVYDAVTFLSNTTDITFAAAQTLLDNKAKVAAAYSKGFTSTDLSVLQKVLTNVAGDKPYTDTDVTNILAGGGDGGAIGKIFTLTAGVDNVSGTAGNDTIVGDMAFNSTTAKYDTPTLGSFDVIDGGAGTDTLTVSNLNGKAYTLPAATIKNVENLVIKNESGDVTADVQSAVGLQDVAITLGTPSDVDVTTKSNVKSVTIAKSNTSPNITDNGSVATTADTLATVTLVANGANATIDSDALTTLNLTNTGNGAIVNAAAGTRTLTVNLNEVTGGTVTDANAKTLNVNSTGKATTGVTLAAAAATSVAINADEKLTVTNLNLAAAKTITVAGDSAVTISGYNAAVLESVNSASSTGGVTITPVLATSVAFTGGAGADTITVTAGNTKAITMGAGDDTVTVTAAALGTGGTVDAGDGTDTLVLSAADAATLSANANFDARLSNFEKVSIGAVAANTANSVDMSGLDDVNYVISAGTAPSGTNETATITFGPLAAGNSITIAGRTVTASSGPATPVQVAAAFSSGNSAGPLTVTPGALSAWTAGAAAGAVVTFTSASVGDVANLTPTYTSVAAPSAPSTSTTNGTLTPPATPETADVTFTGLLIGQSVTVAGRTIIAATGNASADQVAAVAASGIPAGALSVSGTLDGWSVLLPPAVGSAVVKFLSTTPSGDVADITVDKAGTTNSTVVSNLPVDGTPGSSLTLTNVANAGTFELTGVVGGAATVTMKDATGSADSLNIKLNGAANIVNVGTLTVSGVETINIEATDSSVDNPTLTNPAAASKPNLVAADATKIVVTGNHGVDFTGSTLTKVAELDASGVVATGATTGATPAQIATAGAVTFTSAVTDKNVTVKTGNGADYINLSSVTDATKGATVTTGEGDDTITGTAGNDTIDAGAGRDIVMSTAGADSINLGDGNDVYKLVSATHSVLVKSDVITGFSPNTKGIGTSAADVAKGATTTVADLTGDTINVEGLFTNGVVGIKVHVVSSAFDAQTSIQNTGADATNFTGFALDSSTGKLYMDFDQNGTVDSVVTLTGVTTITEAAFVIFGAA